MSLSAIEDKKNQMHLERGGWWNLKGKGYTPLHGFHHPTSGFDATPEGSIFTGAILALHGKENCNLDLTDWSWQKKTILQYQLKWPRNLHHRTSWTWYFAVAKLGVKWHVVAEKMPKKCLVKFVLVANVKIVNQSLNYELLIDARECNSDDHNGTDDDESSNEDLWKICKFASYVNNLKFILKRVFFCFMYASLDGNYDNIFWLVFEGNVGVDGVYAMGYRPPGGY